VIGVDIEAASLRAARASASDNGVGSRTTFTAAITDIPTTSDSVKEAWIIDIEGAEDDYAASSWSARLAVAMVVIECHDFNRPGVTGRLEQAYGASHEIQVIRQSGRDPNAITILRDVDEPSRWLAMDESRPRPMHWLVLRPHRGPWVANP